MNKEAFVRSFETNEQKPRGTDYDKKKENCIPGTHHAQHKVPIVTTDYRRKYRG